MIPPEHEALIKVEAEKSYGQLPYYDKLHDSGVFETGAHFAYPLGKSAGAREIVEPAIEAINKIEDLALNALGLCDTQAGFRIRMKEIQLRCQKELANLAEFKEIK